MAISPAQVFDEMARARSLMRSLDPRVMLRRLIKRVPGLSYITRAHFDAVDYPQYAYGVLIGCMQARALGLDRMTAVEFGVAGGNGLLALGQAGHEIGGALGVAVEAVGFDTGIGLPHSGDLRDLPYWYSAGDYRMDVERLKARLGDCRLVLGNVADTLPGFLAGLKAPIGFCSFDVDYYTSTRDALAVLTGPPETRLPRVLCYFDDIHIGDLAYVSPRIGQLAAIGDFNRANPDAELAKVDSLRHNRPIEATWNDVTYVFQDFRHPLFTQHIKVGDRQIALR
jgi:hypothetical protein